MANILANIPLKSIYRPEDIALEYLSYQYWKIFPKIDQLRVIFAYTTVLVIILSQTSFNINGLVPAVVVHFVWEMIVILLNSEKSSLVLACRRLGVYLRSFRKISVVL